MNYLLLIFFGLAPSLIWLLYFLRKDVHPENNANIVRVFVYGFLAVLPTAIFQLGIFNFLVKSWPDSLGKTIFMLFLVISLSEEFFKYLVVKNKVLSSSEFDEPIDLPLYLIISSLGFAAAENILVLWNQTSAKIFSMALEQGLFLSGLRFISATFLHALSSGVLGIFLALSFFKMKFRKRLLCLGFLLAVGLHGFYNFSIITVGGSAKFLIPVLILINLALVLAFGLRKLKQIKSVCEIN